MTRASTSVEARPAGTPLPGRVACAAGFRCLTPTTVPEINTLRVALTN